MVTVVSVVIPMNYICFPEDTYTKQDVIDTQESLVHVMDTSDKVRIFDVCRQV